MLIWQTSDLIAFLDPELFDIRVKKFNMTPTIKMTPKSLHTYMLRIAASR